MINDTIHQTAQASAMGQNAKNPHRGAMASGSWLDPKAADYIWSLGQDEALDGRSRVLLSWLSRHIETCASPDELIRLGCLMIALEKEVGVLLIRAIDGQMEGQPLTNFLTEIGAPYLMVYREGCLLRDRACRSAVGHIATIVRASLTQDELAGLIGTLSVSGRIVRELGITMRRHAEGRSLS